MLKKFCKGLGVLVTAGLLLLQGANIAEAGVLKVGAKARPYKEDIKKLVAALHAPNMADFINYNYEGHYIAAFSTNY